MWVERRDESVLIPSDRASVKKTEKEKALPKSELNGQIEREKDMTKIKVKKEM